MKLVATAQEAVHTRRHHVLANGTEYFRTNYMTSTPEKRGNPMCYLVEQSPNSVINPHFHEANQFQVFVGGHGLLGRRTIAPLIVHYVDAHTPYGPITSRSEGIQYYTLREEYDPGARFLPEAVKEMKKVVRRHVTTEPTARAAPDELARMTGLSVAPLFAEHADGLGAWLVRAGPSAAVAHRPEQQGGQFWLLLAGGAEFDGRHLAASSFIFVGANEPRPSITAGIGGCELLVTQFPRKAH